MIVMAIDINTTKCLFTRHQISFNHHTYLSKCLRSYIDLQVKDGVCRSRDKYSCAT